ncbi:hypothetical protein GUY44_07390 [Pimelobacter simplex]|uniref:Uncharacterized protein n=1 Tax=Nocardioides simplex TaxID=2045 RepID=A0A0A1DF45_NOCSI|nr:hypothetical protein [Pimelobacter simplex]AIY15846.1 hypothetical protein KR76_01985 [Pimelobacter simplex]MCG8150297.1 hypothetical protein [Pimelobacter simplex]GEB16662.1 hypothetical protein NSI01_49770 [Pimelobacter simplex]SFM90381.1 hypothetical protein SAMN05421671_4121 [Pimelobacter simplex]
MPKTLAELRAEKAAKLPTRSVRLCLNLELVEKVQRLSSEKADLIINATATAGQGDEDREAKARVRKSAERAEPEMPPRVAEIDAELTALWDQMRDYEGDLQLNGVDGAAWQAYKDDHPPREGNISDTRNGNGVVNTTDLMADLGDWAVSWNDEKLTEGDWSGWLSKRIAPADMTDLVRRVVEMQEFKVTVPPKALSGSPSTLSAESADA